MYDSGLRRRERATPTAGGIVTRMRRDAVLIGGSVERLSQPRDRARPTEIPRSRADPPSLLAAKRRPPGYGNAASSCCAVGPMIRPHRTGEELTRLTDHNRH